MLEKEIQVLVNYINQERLLQQAKEVSRYHRIQGSDMYRDAAHACVDTIQSYGIDASIKSYPITHHTFAGPYRLFQEWRCKDAYLDVVYPMHKQIANFKLQPMSIIQKSVACDYRDTPLDVIWMEHGSDEKAYEGVDFHQKILFISEDFHEYDWAIKKGVIGFISDFLREVENVRTREDLYTSLNYTSFWWKDPAEEKKVFGFVLSPQAGDALKEVCKKQRQAYLDKKESSPYIQVCQYIDSQLVDGHIEVVEASLPGKYEESILMVAHLCHPCASANDNASGVSGSIETLHVIKQAIQDAKLLPLDYGITLILVPEFTGTYCYLEEMLKKKKYIAGINLDMIGGRQDDGTGAITITNLPFAIASYEDVYAQQIMQEVSSLPLFKNIQHACVPFGLGSDHSVLNDPLIHIPCIMLGQWPDKHYHTSSDTIDRIDPTVLQFSTLIASAYVYGLARKDTNKTTVLKQIEKQYQQTLENTETTNHYAMHSYYQQVLQKLGNTNATKAIRFEHKEDSRIPKRKYQLPICDMMDILIDNPNLVKQYKQYQKQHPLMQKEYALGQALCDYYMDGIRSIDEIIQCLLYESETLTKESVLAYLHFLENASLISYKE